MKHIPGKILQQLRERWAESRCDAIRLERRVERNGLEDHDLPLESVIAAALEWLCVAQDRSQSADGGVGRAYHLQRGWQSSYPETTGYIVPTFLQCAPDHGGEPLKARAKRMLDWLVAIQLPGGGFQGGRVDSTPIVPVAFNTGQVLIGLAAGEQSFGGYRQPMQRAADWLVSIQDADGCWRKGASPFAGPDDKTYDTHTAWGLLEAARVEPNRGYGDAALANVRWAMTRQHSNGWIDNCCLSNFSSPLTHTLGYALRGIWEAYRFSGDRQFLESARRLADGLKSVLREDGYLPGSLRSDWSSAVKWVCLTGSVQIAYCWLSLFQETGDTSYRDAGFAANSYVRRTVRLTGPLDTRGAVKGSFPIDGNYGRYEYPNWAAKFLIDALVLEQRIRRDAAMGAEA